MLSKEKMAVYQKARREKLKGLPSSAKHPEGVLKCVGCASWEGVVDQRDLEIKKLRADLALAKLELEKRVHTSVVREEVHSGGLPKLKPIGSNYKPNSLYGA